MKRLVDMNLSPRWVNLLADAGIEPSRVRLDFKSQVGSDSISAWIVRSRSGV